MEDGQSSRVFDTALQVLPKSSLPDNPTSLSIWLDSETEHGQFDAKTMYPIHIHPFMVEDGKHAKDLFMLNGFRHLLSAPLVQVFSVQMSTNFSDGKPIAIYGTIYVTEEGKDDNIVLYNRERDDPQIMYGNGTYLSLGGPEGGSISRSRGAILHFNLRDLTRGVVVIKKQLQLDAMSSVYDHEDCYNKLQSAVIEGEYGCVTVYYATFLHAVTAKVKLNLVNVHHALINAPDDVYVSIAARYANAEHYTSNVEEASNFQTSILNVPLRAFLRTKPADWVHQCVVTVPASSALIIEVKVWNSQELLFSNSADFVAEDYGLRFKIVGPRACLFGLEIKWNDAYGQMSVDRSVWGSCVPAVVKPGTTEWTFVEVFSISVGSFSEEIGALCGNIIYGDGLGDFHAFQREENNHLVLQRADSTLPFDSRKNELSSGCYFRMHLDLKDPVQQLQVSRGFLDWNCGLVNSYSRTWFDKRICSIIKGNDGYAAIHYSIFRRAFQASVEVKISLNDASYSSGLSFDLYGSIKSRYRAHEYNTWYEKKYYKSTLFGKPENNPMQVGNGSAILLSKCLLAVPSYSSLIIEVDLGVKCGTRIYIPEDEVCGELEFCCENNLNKTERKEIYGDQYRIKVSVKWMD